VDLSYKVENLFPSPVHQILINDFDDYKDQLIKETYQEKDEDPIGRKISNEGGWQSKSTNIQECKSEVLKKLIIDTFSKFDAVYEGTSMIIEGWKNINSPGNYNSKHNHPRCNLSGVLWIKTPKDSGNIVFESPHNFNRYQQLDMYTEEFRYNTRSYMSYYFTPNEGCMLIFPSDLVHEVRENKSNEDRISYSFNVKLINEE